MQSPEPPPGLANDFDALSATPAVADARFACAVHGTEAGVVRLHGSDGAGWMAIVESFVCSPCERIGPPGAHVLRDALDRADVRRIHALDQGWAPFYCPRCETSYWGACWRTSLVFDPDWPGWLEEQRGVCPAGHDRD